MNAAFIFMILVFGVGILIGAAIGFELYESHPKRCFADNCSGELVIAPGDEDAERYMFLDLERSPDTLEQEEFVVLHVRKIKAREKHSA